MLDEHEDPWNWMRPGSGGCHSPGMSTGDPGPREAPSPAISGSKGNLSFPWNLPPLYLFPRPGSSLPWGISAAVDHLLVSEDLFHIPESQWCVLTVRLRNERPRFLSLYGSGSGVPNCVSTLQLQPGQLSALAS